MIIFQKILAFSIIPQGYVNVKQIHFINKKNKQPQVTSRLFASQLEASFGIIFS